MALSARLVLRSQDTCDFTVEREHCDSGTGEDSDAAAGDS